MMNSIADWTAMEAAPALRVIGELSLNAIDSIPLPILIVVFLALLASLRQPFQPDASLLPSYSPPLSEKSRLSPLPSGACVPLSYHIKGPVFYPGYEHGRGSYVPTSVEVDSSAVVSPGRRSPRRSRIIDRRRSSLGIVAEDEEKVEV